MSTEKQQTFSSTKDLKRTLGKKELMGIAIGVVVSIVRSTWDKAGADMRPGFSRGLLRVLNRIAVIYLTVIRGTPVVIQLMIAYYVIFAFSSNGVLVATLAFGLNSGAYVAEIFRGGIMSIDKGQFEAGRSLGFNYVQTMAYIVVPQVIKNVLPALANEFISLLKETSVAGYVTVSDLTYAGNRIRGVTFSPFMPLIAVALIYLVLGFFFNLWHPGWVIFILIPAYYIVVEPIKKAVKSNHKIEVTLSNDNSDSDEDNED